MTSHASRTTDGRGRLYDSVVDTIGNTPCIRVNRIAPKHVRLYVKAEFFNPAASVKDRLAISIIEERRAPRRAQAGADGGRSDQRQHRHRPGDGVRREGLSAGGHDGRLVLDRAPPHDALPRRQGRPHAARRQGHGHVPEGAGARRGQRLVPRAPVRDRRDNATIHENTTARELLADFDGERLDYWVTGYGTGGTITGVGRVLRKERPETKIILSEPSIAQLLGSGVAQERGADNSPAASHSAFTPHPIQGWTPDFIPYVLQESVDKHYYDELIPIAGPDAIAWSRRLAAEEGIFTGISGGASLAAAMQVAERAPRRLGHLLHAARHRRALPVDAAVRGRGDRHDAGGGSPVEVDARLSDACGLSGPRRPSSIAWVLLLGWCPVARQERDMSTVSIIRSLFAASLCRAVPGEPAPGSRVTLDGRNFDGIVLECGKTSGDADTLIFKGGRFRSTACDRYGYGDGAYTATRSGEEIVFEAETESAAVRQAALEGRGARPSPRRHDDDDSRR